MPGKDRRRSCPVERRREYLDQIAPETTKCADFMAPDWQDTILDWFGSASAAYHSILLPGRSRGIRFKGLDLTERSPSQTKRFLYAI
jgi:hypothetical protein